MHQSPVLSEVKKNLKERGKIRVREFENMNLVPTLCLVSWVRRRDWHILTSGTNTYTNDERFQALHPEGSDDWTLQIKYVQRRDNGTYECQCTGLDGSNNTQHSCTSPGWPAPP
ncbi:Zwei Ig domain protein zig-8 [Frankliniella fusca]|uniref:Zwei Ig domain protein zig-8 n=1 Tax=Frankliniella fusca TaxID=407009 RepID=A0AAE1LFF4_9NEOP|nr:Zwei Ig domain protein zig-8 [Frankliniella fusca]